MSAGDVKQTARKVGDHQALDRLARAGFVVNGIMHLLIGWIALQVALGSGGSADQSGAFAQLASNGFGKAILWLGVIGFVGLALWQLTEAIAGSDEASDRIKAIGKAIAYVAVAFGAFSFANGSGKSSGKQSADFTATLLGKPFGVALVVIVGLVAAAIGVYHVYKGATKKFREDLQSSPSPWIMRAGQFGYIAKGVALVLVGGLFVIAAVRHNPDEATGLDGALKTLAGAPLGQVLLILTALGFAAFGVYCFGRAKHADI